MSMILKGIDIPQKLYTDIRIYKDGRIKKIIGENIMISYNKNAEAIQIPKGHGKIADITKYKKENAMQDDTCEGCPNEAKCIYYTYTKEDICEWLDGIPTILEAEE